MLLWLLSFTSSCKVEFVKTWLLRWMKRRFFFRTPDAVLNIATFIVTLSVIWCLLLLILTATGIILDSQNFECWDINDKTFVASRLNLLFCILLLLVFWRKKGFYAIVGVATTTVLFVVMTSTFILLKEEEAQEIEELENRYLRLIPLRNIKSNPQNWLTDTSCHELINVYHWQAKFKCCGLQGYQDWKPLIPDSCLCEGDDNSTGCVGVGESLVYEKFLKFFSSFDDDV